MEIVGEASLKATEVADYSNNGTIIRKLFPLYKNGLKIGEIYLEGNFISQNRATNTQMNEYQSNQM